MGALVVTDEPSATPGQRAPLPRPDIPTLYRYCAVTPHSLEALRTGGFWFPKPRSFNDPFDCAIHVNEDALEESVAHALKRIASSPNYVPGTIPPDRWKAEDGDARAFATFRDNLSHVLDEVGIFCLAEANDNLLMWSHYADSHRGICIGFARDSSTIFGREVRAVTYKSEYPRLTVAHFDPDATQHSLDQLWLTKSDAWQYEREWRMFTAVGDRVYAIDAPVTSVIFGARISPPARNAVIAATSARTTLPTYHQASIAKTRFAVELSGWSP